MYSVSTPCLLTTLLLLCGGSFTAQAQRPLASTPTLSRTGFGDPEPQDPHNSKIASWQAINSPADVVPGYALPQTTQHNGDARPSGFRFLRKHRRSAVAVPTRL